MTSIKCDQPGCNFVAHHYKPWYARCIIGRHKSSIHGIRSKNWKYSKQGKEAAERGEDVEPTPEAPRELVETINVPNYCPHCGCNIRAVTAALNLKKFK